MTTESPIRMLETRDPKKWLTSVDPTLYSSPFSNASSSQEGFTKFLNESVVVGEQSRMGPARSGSAPPTVDGSIAALRSFMDQKNPSISNSRSELPDCDSEELMRSDPSYIAYYHSHVNLNPRLPPPIISHENRHLLRLIRDAGVKKISVADGLLSTHKEEPEEDSSSPQTSSDQNPSFAAGHNKCAPDLIKGALPKAGPPGFTKPVERENRDVTEMASTSVTCTGIPAAVSPNPKNPDLENEVSTQSNIGLDISVVESRMKSLDVSAGLATENNQRRLDNLHLHDQYRRFQAIGSQHHAIPQGLYGLNHGMEKFATVYQKLPGMQPVMHSPGLVPPLYATTAAHMNSANLVHPGLLPAGFPSPQFSIGGFSTSSGLHHPPLGGYIHNDAHHLQLSFMKAPMEPMTGEISPHRSQMMYMTKPHMQNAFVLRPFMGPVQGRYIQPGIQEAQPAAQQKDADVPSLTGYKEVSHSVTGNLSMSPSMHGSHSGVSYYGYPPSSYYGYPPSVVMPQFAMSSPAGLGSPISGVNHPGLGNDPIASEHSSRIPSALSCWKGQRGPENSDETKRNSFLELLKSSSSKKLELSDISGQIVEFSTDQHGSRFIQQKLEHCSTAEKDSVFKEVFPCASKLMTDVFGNYVIQKFFDHGTLEHKKKLGEQLTGQVLSLSLQMYGCRVIQKALEVIELDQKVALVQELDGHVMRCVHDQNGNHVIQKCIESIPANKIGFIISSFFGQVSALSSHPYGCRVIQRILEHCPDEQINQSIVGEILESTCMLAQDPYGNYVTQHILETGKPRERSQIIQKLAGKFIQMSQLKFASNVVEKCLKHGNASERDLIIEEFISGSDNNDSLLMLMKDQFANYVVQKLFDIGTEKQKEAFLNCIKSHLPELKRFSYAKQIVARYESLTEAKEAQDQA